MMIDLSRVKKTLAAASLGSGTAPVPNLGAEEDNVTLSRLIDLLDLGGVPRDKLGEATYFACLRMLSEGIGRLPLKLMQHTEEGGVLERRDLPLYHTLRYRPNPFSTSTRFWATVETHRNHFGNAYVWLQPAGQTFRMWQLPSNQVRIWWDNKRILADQEHIWYIWTAPDGKQYPFCDDEIMHFRTWLSLDGVTGLAVQDILRLTLEGAQKSQQMLNGLYDNGFTAKAVVQYTGDLNGKLEQTFLQSIENYAAGKMGNRIIPIPMGHKLEPLNIKLTDGQFLELRKYTALQVAAAFGIKPDQINDFEKSSYASSEAQQLAFLVDTQLYILKDYEEEIGYKSLSDEQRTKALIYPKFNTAVALRADTKTQIETLATAVSNEIYTPDEARGFLDLSRKPGGDRLYANGNLIPLELAGKQYEGREGRNEQS